MATYTQLHDGNPDGVQIGSATTDLVGFYGETPVDQAGAITTVTTDAATSTTNAFGYSTSTQADAIVTAVNALIAAVQGIGITA